MKLFLNALLITIFLLVSAHPIFAQSIPQPVGYVNDFAHLYSPSYVTSLDSSLKSFEASTSAEIVVVTVENLQDTPIEDYAVSLFEKWKIGKEKKDNGILVLIAKDEREARIEVGYGLEGVVNDSRAGRIIREDMTPKFKEGNYEQGTTNAVQVLMKYIKGEPVSIAEEPKKDWSGLFNFVPFIFFGLIYLGSFMARTKDYYVGGIVGAILGGGIGLIIGPLAAVLFSSFALAMIGLLLDYILSKNYQNLSAQQKRTDWWGSNGGFGGGGRSSSGGGFGGFGGGSSGGGGASGKW